MFHFAQQLHDELLQKLESRDENGNQPAYSHEQRLGIITDAIGRLKEKLKTAQFSVHEEEACFFKDWLPLFLSHYIYHTEISAFESTELRVTPQLRNEYLERLFRKMNDFYKENADFLRYYRSGKTNLDNYYFLRSSLLNQENNDPLMDLSFCTVYSIKVATLKAYGRLEQDIRNQFNDLHGAGKPAGHPGIRLKWTDTKSGAIELIYSLKEKGSFNNGEADLQTIVDYFEYMFSVRLDNPYRSFQEILSRKTGYTIYLDKLKDGFIRKINEMEGGDK